jgi:hypothetical protein
MAAELVDHRNRMKKPFTVGAAKRLAQQFLDTGKPIEAARMMIDRAWQGFRADWFENARAPRAPPPKLNGHAHRGGSISEALEQQAERIGNGELFSFGPLPVLGGISDGKSAIADGMLPQGRGGKS